MSVSLSVTLQLDMRCCAQAGKGSATLSMAYAAAEFAASCLRALAGEPGVVECAYVESHLTELPFFASPVRLGRHGVEARACAAVLACSPSTNQALGERLVCAAGALLGHANLRSCAANFSVAMQRAGDIRLVT